jgi:hypothetical protein
MDGRERRIGLNEALFREVNEAVRDVSVQLDASSDFEIVCECGALGCSDRIQLTPEAYAALRSDASHFAVVPGHQIPDVEEVITNEGTYLIVEKCAPDARKLAEQTDPTR